MPHIQDREHFLREFTDALTKGTLIMDKHHRNNYINVPCSRRRTILTMDTPELKEFIETGDYFLEVYTQTQPGNNYGKDYVVFWPLTTSMVMGSGVVPGTSLLAGAYDCVVGVSGAHPLNWHVHAENHAEVERRRDSGTLVLRFADWHSSPADRNTPQA